MANSLSYSQHLLSQDGQVSGRVMSIMKDEGFSKVGEDPTPVVWKYMPDIAAEPMLAEAYHAALINERAEPGAADDVITDGMLLSAVTAVWNKIPVPEPESEPVL